MRFEASVVEWTSCFFGGVRLRGLVFSFEALLSLCAALLLLLLVFPARPAIGFERVNEFEVVQSIASVALKGGLLRDDSPDFSFWAERLGASGLRVELGDEVVFDDGVEGRSSASAERLFYDGVVFRVARFTAWFE